MIHDGRDVRDNQNTVDLSGDIATCIRVELEKGMLGVRLKILHVRINLLDSCSTKHQNKVYDCVYSLFQEALRIQLGQFFWWQSLAKTQVLSQGFIASWLNNLPGGHC